MKTKDIDDLIKIVEVISQINIPNYIISIDSDEIIKTLEDVKLTLTDVSQQRELLKAWEIHKDESHYNRFEVVIESDMDDFFSL